MPLFLINRQPQLSEKMDDPNCKLSTLFNTYKSFATINKLLSGWNIIYKREIFPFLELNNGTATLLDIGFGGGDIPVLLYKLAKKDGFTLNITAIDTDERSVSYANKTYKNSPVNFIKANSKDLVNKNHSFDFVISNHLLHHLNDSDLLQLCDDAKKLATNKVLFNDILRSDIGYVSFGIISKLFFHRSFISYDGLVSIKRSFTPSELKEVCPNNWIVSSSFPFRILLKYEC